MTDESVVKLTWHGEETVEAVLEHIGAAQHIEVIFPSNYNHALFRALNPEASEGAAEDLDAQGGAEVLTRMARVSGLESLARLRQALGNAGARIELYSPPRLIITFKQTGEQAKG